MKTKTERLNDIKKLERKALKLLKDSSNPKNKTRNINGLEINKMLEAVIILENEFEKDFGKNPGKYEPKSKKKKYNTVKVPDVWE